MKKRGFTLIELLAVIVILAIIALIATPMVLNTIDEAKKGSAKSSGYSYISGVETALASYMLKNNGVSYRAGDHDVEELDRELDVALKGDKPTDGEICIGSNGTVTKASLKISGYIVNYDGKETSISDTDTVEDITCDVIQEGPTQVLATNGETYKAIVYLDPTDLTKTCNASNSVSTTGTKDGCMKWYVYNDDGTNYTMILDHNTTEFVAYASVQTELASLSGWKVTPSVISANEIASITGNEDFDASSATDASYFYFDSKDHTSPETKVTSNYAWLFDYTDQCDGSDNDNKGYVCNVSIIGTLGYWTSDPVTSSNDTLAWVISRNGRLISNSVTNSESYGIRPVIEISKNILQ